MKEILKEQARSSYLLWAVRIFFSLAVVAVLAFIFSNSAASGETSSAQSYAVTEQVQQAAQVIAPHSKIATAQGEDFIKLHISVRTAAHFCQFALLGAVAFGCYLSYTQKKLFALMPTVGSVAVAFLDESLQIFSNGRAFEWSDIFVDSLGGLCGCLFSLLVFLAARAIICRIQKAKGEMVNVE